MIQSLMENVCEHANPWAQQFWQDIQGLKEVDQGECFLLLLKDRIMDFWALEGSLCFLASLAAKSCGIGT